MTYKSLDDLERLVLGTNYKTVHQAAKKCISNAAVLVFYNSGHGMIKDSHTVLERSHPFSTYAKISEKLTFVTPDTHTYVCISGGKKC